MEIRSDNQRLIIRAPAKLNLFLEIVRKRPDGYHDLETVMQTISIYDTLTLERRGDAISFATEASDVPHDASNLVVRAAEALCEHASRRLGAAIRLEKTIPAGSGMGGGSSDCAAALVGLNRLWELNLPIETLHDLASRLGSDVAFFLYGGTALCKGRGERVTPLAGVKPMTYVVVCPAIRVSTKEAYEKYRAPLTKDVFDTKLFLADLRKGGMPRFANRLENVTLALHEPLQVLRRQMVEAGLDRVTMTGSGSAFFGVATDRKEARGIVKNLKALAIGEVFLSETVS